MMVGDPAPPVDNTALPMSLSKTNKLVIGGAVGALVLVVANFAPRWLRPDFSIALARALNADAALPSASAEKVRRLASVKYPNFSRAFSRRKDSVKRAIGANQV